MNHYFGIGWKWLNTLWGALRRAIVSERAQHYRAMLFQTYVLVALIAFTILALFASQNPYFSFDLETTIELQGDSPAWILPVMRAISWPGFAVQGAVIIALVGVALYIAGLHWEAYSAVAAGISSSLLNTLIKLSIRRPRPDDTLVEVFNKLGTYSFPSGHVMFYVAFFGFLLFLAFLLIKRALWRWLSVALLLALVVGVGFSRIYLGDHWASDVLGGYILGSVVLLVVIRFYRWGKQRIKPQQPVAPATPAPGPDSA